METIKYIDSKEKCQAGIDAKHLVCSHCGGERVPIETVDNASRPTYWPGCMSCERFDYGVTPIVYEVAKKMVTEHFYRHYSHMDSPNGKDESYQKYYTESQIGGTTSIVMTILKLHSELTK